MVVYAKAVLANRLEIKEDVQTLKNCALNERKQKDGSRGWKQRILTVGGSTTVRLVPSLTRLDSTKKVQHMNPNL